MESDQQQIITLIHQMRTNQVNQAQQKLMSMATNIQFLDKIFNIIQNNHLQSWVKTIAATFLNRVICQKLQQFGYKNMFAAMNNIMSSYNVLPSDKRCFQRSLISLIEYIQEPAQIDQWRNFILKHLNDPLLFDTGLLLISCTTIAQIQIDYLCLIIQETFELTVKSVSVSLENAMTINELIKNWIIVFDKLISLEDEVVNEILLKICTSKSLAKLLFSVYQFQSPGQIWLCVKPQLYELNILKYEAAELNKRVANYAKVHKLAQTKCPCLQIIIQSYNTIKNTIAVIGANNNLGMLDAYQCEDFITSLISLLVIYVKTIGEPSQQQMNILQHLVSYPFLKTRDQQIDIFQQSPQQFNTLAEDICDKQTFGILKTEAGKLLQTIADRFKSVMQKSIIFCIQCIKMSIGYIPKYQNTDVKILDLQSAFQILALYSFSIQQYPNHLQSLKIILCDKRMMELRPLELSKVFLFLAYNYGQIFKNPFDGSFWIQFALSYQVHPTTRYMGLDFISNIVDEYFTENFFEGIIKLIMTGLPRESGQVWNIVRKLFEAQMNKISQPLCLNLVNTVFDRIERQISQLQKKQKQQTINLINALHVLRRIIQQKDYINGKQSLKVRIFDIVVIFQKTVYLNLQDQIIKILIQYMKLDQEMTKQKIYQYLPAILEQFKKQGFHQKPYFILLNEIIVKSKFQSIQPIIKSLLTGLMFHLFDMSQNAKKNKQRVALANILTLLQNLLSIHGYQMSGGQNDCLCEIGAMCVRLFPAEGQKVFSKPLLAKALNLMFICHLYSKTQNTVDYLIQYAKQNIFHKYDAYVLTKLLAKALFAQDNIHIVIEYLNLMIDITNEEQQNQKKGLSVKNSKGKMKIKRDEQLNDLLFKITSPFINFDYKKSNRHFPIKDQVIQCINQMRSNNIETYKLIVMNMNEQQKAKLVRIMNQIVEVQGKKRVIRKIVGVRNLNQDGTQEKPKNQNSDVQQNEDDQSTNFKRQRVLQKKKQSKKKKSNQISVQ